MANAGSISVTLDAQTATFEKSIAQAASRIAGLGTTIDPAIAKINGIGSAAEQAAQKLGGQASNAQGRFISGARASGEAALAAGANIGSLGDAATRTAQVLGGQATNAQGRFIAGARASGDAAARAGAAGRNMGDAIASGAKKASKDVDGLSKALAGIAGAGLSMAAIGKGFDLSGAASASATAGQVFLALGGDIEQARQSLGGMVSDSEIFKKANLAETMGISSDSFNKLAKISTAAAAKTGQSVGFMFDSIITGTARQSKMILDNLGIMVNLESANTDYAKSLGKTAESLSDAEKKQAFMNAVFKDGDRMVRQLEEAGISLSAPFDKATAAFQNIGDDIGGLLIPAFEAMFPIVDSIASAIDRVRTAFDRLSPDTKETIGLIVAVTTGIVVLTGTIGTASVAVAAFGGAIKAAAITAAGAFLPFLVIAAKVALIVVGLVSLAAVLRVAWERNLGGIRDLWRGLVLTVKWALEGIWEGAKWLFGALETGWDSLFRFQAAIITAIPRLVVKATASALSVIEDLLGKARDAASYLGFEELAGGLAKARGSFAGVRASVQGLEGDIDSAIDTAAEFLNPLKLIRTGASGTWDFLTGEGGAKFGAAVKEALATSGEFIGEGLGLILKDLGIDLGALMGDAAADPIKKIGKELGEDAGKQISDEMKKAREQFRDLLGGLRERQAEGASEFADVTKALASGAAEQKKIAELAAQAGLSSAEAMELSRAHTVKQAAAAVSANASLDDFARAADFARKELAAAGYSAEDFSAALEYKPGDLSDILSLRVGELLDTLLAGEGLELSATDRKTVVSAFSDAASSALQGKIDTGPILSGLGTLIAGADIGGLGSMVSDLFGLTAGTADPVVSANQELASSADLASSALEGMSNVIGSMDFDLGDLDSISGEGSWEFTLEDLGEAAPVYEAMEGFDFDLSGVADAASALSGGAGSLEAVASTVAGVAGAGGGAGGIASALGALGTAGGGAAAAGAAGAAGAGALGGAAAGAGLGAIGGPVGMAVGAAVAVALPIVIEAIEAIGKAIHDAAGIIPKAIGDFVEGFAGDIGDARLSKAIKAIDIEGTGTAIVLASLAAAALLLFPPFTLIAGVLAIVGGLLVAVAIALAPFLVIIGALGVLFAGISLVLSVLIGAIATVASVLLVLVGVVSAVVSTLSILLSPLGLVAVALVAVAALIAGPILSLLGALAGAIATVLGTFALFAALFVLTKETESFKRFSAAFGAVMDRVIKALEPFFQGLMFIPALFDGLISVLMPIVHAFADTGEVGKILFDVLKNVAIGLGYFLLGIGHFITAIAHGTNAVLSILAGFIDGIASVPIMIKNAILGGLSGFLYALSDLAQTFGLGDIAQTLSGAADDLAGEMEIFRGTDLADFLRDMGNAALGLAPDLDAMGTALEDLTNLTYEEAMTRGEILAKEKEASESLTNVPSGFKIAAERFRAIVGEDMGTGVVGPESSPDTAGGGSVYIENISLTAENLADFIRQINELNDRQGIQFTGRFPRYADALNNGSSG